MSRLDKQNPFKSTAHKIKVFFCRQQWKETLIFLFFVLLSLGFWLLQSLQQEYEIEISVPVKYKNVPAGMNFTEDNPRTVVAKIRDKGTVLINYLWFRAFVPIEVDIKGIQKDTNRQIIVNKKIIETSISKQLISTTSLIGFEPQSILVEYKELLHKEIPVLIDASVMLEPGFQFADSMTVVPATVRVYGSNEILDTLSTLSTEPIVFTKVNKTREFTIRLQKIPGTRIEPDEVKVTIPIEQFTEKRLILPVICDNLPENFILRTFPSSVEIICNVPLSRFRDLVEADFEIRIPYSEFEANQTAGKLSVYLTKQPSWIVNPVINPNVIEFIIEQNNQ